MVNFWVSQGLSSVVTSGVVSGARGYLGVNLQLGIEVKTIFILISNHPH